MCTRVRSPQINGVIERFRHLEVRTRFRGVIADGDGLDMEVLHAEPRTPDGVDRVGGTADFHRCGALTAEEIKQQLAGGPGDACRGLSSPGSDGNGRAGPLEHQSRAAQTPSE